MKVIDRILITRDGWVKLQRELEQLRSKQDSQTSEYLSIVLDSEPGEAGSRYLQSEVASIERRIKYLEEVLAKATPVQPENRVSGTVGVGSRVTVQWDDGSKEEYWVVGPPEVDPHANRISYESPVGRGLLGRSKGEWIEVTTPGGTSQLRVVAVE